MESRSSPAASMCFWVLPRPVLNRVGRLDERFEWGYWEDDDYLARLHQAGIPAKRVASVRVNHIGGLTTTKVPEHKDWLERNEQVFKEKWGRGSPPLARYRRVHGSAIWHFCQNCQDWPVADYEDAPSPFPGGPECARCASLRDRKECAFF